MKATPRDPLAKFAVALRQSFSAFLQGAIRFRAVNGDHRLRGKGLQQFDLAIGVAASPQFTLHDAADRFIASDKGN